MKLPRWTTYPALAALFAMVWMAVPRRVEPADPTRHPRGARGGAIVSPKFDRVVVLGIDGLDPEILAETMQRFPELTKNFKQLVDENGLHSLGTSTPPQSPVAWSNFITGLNPGGHGIFDFIHRDPITRSPIPSTAKSTEAKNLPLWGDWQLPLWGDRKSVV